ncbi:MAG: hypothetical protein Q7J80_02955 [Anaerolineales bacterium]|nr:hypothetical protein [Anaerolineales bacterium]
MPDAPQIYQFTHQELAEILIKHKNIHEGLWGIYVEFGLGATNFGQGPNDILPAAIVPIIKLGLQKFTEPNNLTVDAAKINPS